MALLEHLKKQFMNSTISDVTLVAHTPAGEYKEIPAHLLLLSQSKVFERMFAEAFVEGTSRRAEIEVTAVKLVVQLVRYLYTHEMDFQEDAPWSFRDLFDLLALFDQYEVLGEAPKIVMDQMEQKMQQEGSSAVAEVLNLAAAFQPAVHQFLAEDQLDRAFARSLESGGIEATLLGLDVQDLVPDRTKRTIDLILRKQVAEVAKGGLGPVQKLVTLAAQHSLVRLSLDDGSVAKGFVQSLRSVGFGDVFEIMKQGLHAELPTLILVKIAWCLSNSVTIGNGELLQVLPWAFKMASRKCPASIDWTKFQVACLVKVSDNPKLLERELQAAHGMGESLLLKRCRQLIFIAAGGYALASERRRVICRGCRKEMQFLCSGSGDVWEYECFHCVDGPRVSVAAEGVATGRCLNHDRTMQEIFKGTSWICCSKPACYCGVEVTEAPRGTCLAQISKELFEDMQAIIAQELAAAEHA